MDLKKEIKLSDLFGASGGRTSAKPPPSSRPKSRRSAPARRSSASRSARRSSRPPRVANNGSARAAPARTRAPLRAGIVVGGEVRDIPALAARAREFFRTHKLPRRGVRLGLANNRIGVRSFEIAGIDDEDSSRTRSASAPTSALDPARRGGASTTTSSARSATTTARPCAAPCSSPPTASRSSATSRAASGRRRASPASTSRRSPSCAPLTEPRPESEPPGARSSSCARPRAHDPRGLGREDLLVRPRARLGRAEPDERTVTWR